MFLDKSIIRSITIYTIKYREHSLNGIRKAIRNIEDYNVAIAIHKAIKENSSYCDVILEEKTINIIDKTKI